MQPLRRNKINEMKILLINPFVRPEKIYGRLAIFSPALPPLGLCYLGSYLQKYGHKVEILDLNISHQINLIDFVNSSQPDIIGVTSTTVSFSSAKNILKTIKSHFPGVITVLGGSHISTIPAQTMNECLDIDIGVIGEGEVTFKELIDIIKEKQDLTLCPGIIYRKNNSLIKTNPRPLIENLDTLPFPARDLLKEFSKYYHHFLRGEIRTASIITSRGCPCKCAYCTQAVFGANVRGHSPDYVCEEIKKVKADFGVNFFSIEDDIFNYNRQRLRTLCEKILSENLNIRFGCSVRIDFIDKGDIELMEKAGCEKIYIGVETFNKRIQKLINKQIEESLLMEKIKMVKSHNIKINASFMLGLPTQTKQEIEETINKATSLPVDGAIFFLYTPYPGTPLRQLAEKVGVVSRNWDDYSTHLNTHAFYPDSIDIKTLDKLIFSAYRKFYFRPKFVAKNCINILRQVAKVPFSRSSNQS